MRSMRRSVLVVIAAIAITGLFAQQALAQNPHLKGRNPVSFTDNILTLTGTVSYAGLWQLRHAAEPGSHGQSHRRLRQPRHGGASPARPQPCASPGDGVNRGARG
jgi:hypothetical protein